MKAILTFHSIDDSGSVLSYAPDLFDRLLRLLDESGIPVLDLGALLAPDTDRGVAITFDDGMQSVLSNALPVLKDHTAPAHLFVATSAIDGETPWPDASQGVGSFDMLSWDEIEDLHHSGVFIDAHTVSHPDLRKLSAPEIAAECEAANDKIALRLGRRPEYFAYPFGYHDLASRDVCRELYRACVTTELRTLSDNEDPAALPRLDTYYLQSAWTMRNLEHPAVSGYLKLRWLLRTLRGTHCVAAYDA